MRDPRNLKIKFFSSNGMSVEALEALEKDVNDFCCSPDVTPINLKSFPISEQGETKFISQIIYEERVEPRFRQVTSV
ncbi:hypothetical protein Goe26_00590 [Bacillus phage vB_BsuM-Goe26]|nr:hypothetical protein Goe26_00590 [Bacillus phage vB_BsuM-Goe26]GLI90558.1 hypothetical protein ANABIO4_39100 [Bacillus subtilis]